MHSKLKVVRSDPFPQIDDEFKNVIPQLSSEERRQLEATSLSKVFRDALVIWKGILLDGHNRLEICTRLGIPYRTCEVELPEREAAKLWIEETQIGRRKSDDGSAGGDSLSGFVAINSGRKRDNLRPQRSCWNRVKR